MTTALIDGDIICYRSAASCQQKGITVEPVEVAIMRVNDLMQRILHETESDSYKAYLTGSNNFRYEVNPDYKGNRKDVPRPEWLQQCREHLVVEWKATVEDGQEADDALGIEQMRSKDTIICSIDKDLLMIPGEHYDFVKGIRREQFSIPAIRHFYWQLLMGDRTDNIFGFDGKARQSVPKFLEPVFEELASYDDELDMFGLVQSLYNDDARLLMNGRCLWIRREPEQVWNFPT